MMESFVMLDSLKLSLRALSLLRIYLERVGCRSNASNFLKVQVSLNSCWFFPN